MVLFVNHFNRNWGALINLTNVFCCVDQLLQLNLDSLSCFLNPILRLGRGHEAKNYELKAQNPPKLKLKFYPRVS